MAGDPQGGAPPASAGLKWKQAVEQAELSHPPGGTEIAQLLWKTGRIYKGCTLQPSNATPHCFSDRNTHVHSPKNTDENFHSSTAQSDPNTEAFPKPTCRAEERTASSHVEGCAQRSEP